MVTDAARAFLRQQTHKEWSTFSSLLSTMSDLQPRLLVSEGCSGSTSAITQLKEMMKAHGHKLDFQYNSELFKCEKNPECEEKKGGETLGMKVAVAKAVAAGTTLVLKTQGNGNPETRKTVQQMGAYAVVAYRSNVLARLLCEARDCFDLVRKADASAAQERLTKRVGPHAEACFPTRRELPPDKQTKVWIDPEGGKLVETLGVMEKNREVLAAHLREAGYADGSYAVVTTEALFEAETDGSAAALHRTARAWEETLRSLGVPPDHEKILEVLGPRHGARAPSSSYDSISNAEEVVKLLGRNAHYAQMVGQPPHTERFEVAD